MTRIGRRDLFKKAAAMGAGIALSRFAVEKVEASPPITSVARNKLVQGKSVTLPNVSGTINGNITAGTANTYSKGIKFMNHMNLEGNSIHNVGSVSIDGVLTVGDWKIDMDEEGNLRYIKGDNTVAYLTPQQGLSVYADGTAIRSTEDEVFAPGVLEYSVKEFKLNSENLFNLTKNGKMIAGEEK